MDQVEEESESEINKSQDLAAFEIEDLEKP